MTRLIKFRNALYSYYGKMPELLFREKFHETDRINLTKLNLWDNDSNILDDGTILAALIFVDIDYFIVCIPALFQLIFEESYEDLQTILHLLDCRDDEMRSSLSQELYVKLLELKEGMKSK